MVWPIDPKCYSYNKTDEAGEMFKTLFLLLKRMTKTYYYFLVFL